MLPNLREKLTAAEARIRGLREEKARAVKVADAAKATVAAVSESGDNSAQYEAAKTAVAAVKAIEAKIEDAQEEQTDLLRRLGDAEAGMGGWTLPGINGWAEAARRLDLQRGETQVSVGLDALIDKPLAALDWAPDLGSSRAPSLRAPLVEKGADQRFVYPVFQRQPLDSGDLAVTEYVQFGERAVTGSVERDPSETTDKANIGLQVKLASENVRTFACVVENVPAKLFDAEPALTGFLRNELQLQVSLAIDANVVSQIEAAAPPSGQTGSNLIAQVRNAVAASRALGASPSVLALNPTDAASLDMTTTGADGAYMFATRGTGSASPLWNLSIVESPTVTDPLVIDPVVLGVLYTGTGTILTDPYSSMERNVVRVRVEGEALFHVRDIAGAYVIA
jgi:hypothetical protein